MQISNPISIQSRKKMKAMPSSHRPCHHMTLDKYPFYLIGSCKLVFGMMGKWMEMKMKQGKKDGYPGKV